MEEGKANLRVHIKLTITSRAAALSCKDLLRSLMEYV